MSSVLTDAPKQRVSRVRELAVAIVVVLAVASAFFAADRLTRGPEFVERISVRNRTDYQVAVRLESGDDQWLALATIPPGRTAAVYSVLDPGATWVFEFRVGGDSFGELDTSRERLERSGWRLDVP